MNVGSREWCERILNADFERHWGLQPGAMSQGRVAHIRRDARLAVWTANGGVVTCENESLASGISGVLAGHSQGAYERLVPDLRSAVGVKCSLDALLYCLSPAPLQSGLRDRVETLRAEDIWPDRKPGGPEYEHFFGIREGSLVVSRTYNLPQTEADGRRFHAIDVGTHPEHRGRGLAKAVVSALIEHIASEGGVSLWNCDVENAASLRLARSVGFVDYLWRFTWGDTR